MLIAATTSEEADIERATVQMERALRRDNLVVTMPHGSYSLGDTAAKQKMEIKVVVSLEST